MLSADFTCVIFYSELLISQGLYRKNGCYEPVVIKDRIVYTTASMQYSILVLFAAKILFRDF